MAFAKTVRRAVITLTATANPMVCWFLVYSIRPCIAALGMEYAPDADMFVLASKLG